MESLLWIVMGGISALCIWIWFGPFGRQFPRRSHPVRAMQAEAASRARPSTHGTIVYLLRALVAVVMTSLVFTTAGCAVRRPTRNDSSSWMSTSYDTTARDCRPDLRLCADQPWSPELGVATVAHDDFNFTHPRVERFVVRFQSAGRGSLRTALWRSRRYVRRMSTILRKRGVPPELAYLPLIESGFRSHAVSRAGAVGPWQFIAATGRRYGLRIDRYVDERRDPVKSTEAAAKYFKDLYAMFGDWHLTLAAYNSGEQNIARILATHHTGDFWEMRRRGYLCTETADFVPQFLAALHIAEHPETYGFVTPTQQPIRYDLVRVRRSLTLATVARLSGASRGAINELNPALHRGVVPPHGYAVRVPRGTKAAFELAYASLRGTGHGYHHMRPATTKAVVEVRLPALFANFGG